MACTIRRVRVRPPSRSDNLSQDRDPSQRKGFEKEDTPVGDFTKSVDRAKEEFKVVQGREPLRDASVLSLTFRPPLTYSALAVVMIARKIITLPSLSPTHTSARIVRLLVPSGTNVTENQPVLVLRCSPDLIADPADRKTPGHRPTMLMECMEEGRLRWNEVASSATSPPGGPDGDGGGADGKWLKVGDVLGEIVDDDDDDDDEEWKWQAYLHEEE